MQNNNKKNLFNLVINLYFTVITCILTLNRVEYQFCPSDSRMYITLQNSVRTEDGSAKSRRTQDRMTLTPWPF